MGVKRQKTIVDSLQYVADNPEQSAHATIDVPVWELCSSLFWVANNPDPKVRGSMSRATRAQRMISERLVGKRRAGTAPAERRNDALKFEDLTGGAISG